LRLDKWLKVSRLIKRRTVAQMACEQHRVYVNDRPAKSATELNIGDKIHLELGASAITVEIISIPTNAVNTKDASTLYRIVEKIRRPSEIPFEAL
jgi:ribosomal 50S subunit-recycling heat shock protein